ncbi:TrkA family potassium uptake protein [Bacillus sp. 31A1R]|uniref:TrkA family potassium uptake protein n=1 Tax=Robertmurraya mangrovi TaxID=3098077 RepID=A0ABU5J0N0_9BACI|nr:TrkA family potassium uptake protein [Bacillus sp. 31A1R]MDZ5472912.1 TrkA family potassium uptake protein [Bacillus sp. 31A1R]
MKKQFAVIGLGRFGSSVCKELYHLGHDVLAIDNDEVKLNGVSDYATHHVITNATDESALKSLGIRNFDYVIVAIGDHIQSSILCTMLLKEIGVKKVWVKAQNDYHHKVLEKIGADRIVRPEHDMGIRVAHHLDSERIIDYIELSEDYSIVELVATEKNNKQTLIEMDVRAKFGCTVLAIKRGSDVNISPSPMDEIVSEDILVVMGHKNDLKRFEAEGM